MASLPPVLMMVSFQVLIAIVKWVMLHLGRPLNSAAALSSTGMPGYGAGLPGPWTAYGQMPNAGPWPTSSGNPQNGHGNGGGEPTTGPDYCPSWALRSCPDCATSPTEGFIPTTLAAGDPDNAYPWSVDVYAPCPGCNPTRAEVAKAGQLHLAHDRAGRPTGWSGDGNAARS